LAGQQPRRGQILELIDWYERQLTQLGVTIERNSPLDASEIQALQKSLAADEVVITTGSQPSATGFQRQLPAQDHLPGMALPNVFSIEDVMNRSARLGTQVVLAIGAEAAQHGIWQS
jgi:thioredoxin reductase